MTEIIKEREIILNRFIENADKCPHRDRGIEGWFQTELIARLWNEEKPITHYYKGPYLLFPDGYEIELKMTTCFRPDWIIGGMIKNNDWTPVLFFSGYLDYWNKKNKPDYDDKVELREWFENYFYKKHPSNVKFVISHRNTIELMNDKDKKVLFGVIEKK